MRIGRIGRTRLLLSAWALLPPAVIQSDTGEVRFAFGGGVGRHEELVRNCDGDVVSAVPVEAHSLGGRVDVLNDPFRITGFGGMSSATGADGLDRGGPYGGLVLAYEGDVVGLGTGIARLPDAQVVPSLYLRTGSRASHLRVDVFAPTVGWAATNGARLGGGFEGSRARGFVGFGAGRRFGDAEVNAGPFLDLELALSPSLELLFSGSWHLSQEHPDWGAGIGAQFRRRRP